MLDSGGNNRIRSSSKTALHLRQQFCAFRHFPNERAHPGVPLALPCYFYGLVTGKSTASFDFGVAFAATEFAPLAKQAEREV
jgi:hypothetical protein